MRSSACGCALGARSLRRADVRRGSGTLFQVRLWRDGRAILLYSSGIMSHDAGEAEATLDPEDWSELRRSCRGAPTDLRHRDRRHREHRRHRRSRIARRHLPRGGPLVSRGRRGAFARLIEQNVAQAEYLAGRVEARPDLELMAPVALNIVCFRYHPEGVSGGALDALNEEVVLRLQESGLAVPSGTRLRGQFVIRVAIVNHRSRREDFDALVDGVLRFGREIVREGMVDSRGGS